MKTFKFFRKFFIMRILFVFLIGLYSSSLLSMSYVEAVECLVYFPGVFTINALAKIKAHRADEALKNIEKTRSRTEVKSYCDSEITRIDQRLKTIKDDLRKEEKEAMAKIYQDFGLSSQDINYIGRLIEHDMSHLQKHLTDFTISSQQDVHFSDKVQDSFLRQGLNLRSIEIIRRPHGHPERPDHVMAGAFVEYDDKGEFVGPRIFIHEGFWSHSPIEQEVIMKHEIGHILSGHNIKRRFLTAGIIIVEENKMALDSKNSETISAEVVNRLEENMYFRELRKIYEKQANILHKSADAAELMKDSAAMNMDPRLLLPHYCQLSDIDALHKRRRKLEVLRKPVIKLKKEPLTVRE